MMFVFLRLPYWAQNVEVSIVGTSPEDDIPTHRARGLSRLHLPPGVATKFQGRPINVPRATRFKYRARL